MRSGPPQAPFPGSAKVTILSESEEEKWAPPSNDKYSLWLGYYQEYSRSCEWMDLELEMSFGYL
jgi:hypothetical protein